MKSQALLNRREQVDDIIEEEKTPVPRLEVLIVQGTDEVGPVNIPLPETPEPKRGVLSRTEGTPYCAD